MSNFGARFEYRKDLYSKAKELRKDQTKTEQVFWRSVLKSHPFNLYTWNRQKPIHRFIVDFYCSKLQLVVEIDGSIHEYNVNYDQARTDYLNQLGLKVIRFSNDEVLHDQQRIRDQLLTELRSKSSPAPSLGKKGD